MKRIFKFIEKYFFIIILLAVGISLLYPNSFAWVLSEYSGINIINLLLSIVLFTMGTTLKVDDFINVFKNPKEIAAGISAQYIIMPLIAFCLASAFSLDTALTVGIILVGTVPGGTASDVITFLAKGDVALSVSLTAVSTVISPILTPLITLLLIGNQIQFNPVDMFISIVEIVIVPIAIGLTLNYKFPDFCEKLKDYLPAISSMVVCLIVAGVIGANKQAILTSSMIIIVVIVLQYFIAMGLGFAIGHLVGMGRKQIITVAIELAFQNSGLSTSLAKTHFPSLSQATVPGALYSVWQNFAGSILAYIFRRYL
ncbi:MAG: bile acid:sodium symporter family protein [Methanobrevibacter sp.]|uniref:bile acid:sodium symporter family protein n=1 Tax=Methanobrevibacter sp. TaxID=66852 RepID=UPI00257A6C7E|nr:bile acid:sodium symporter family protein [Methanobrevibacter sp.]MBR2665360.1 bile acid:sodium symporter family protein [Methanobrevibacter sp.]MBR3197905.1 bile acid:sodium symporter family protein [Methanobrevibacter sp.]MBR6927988.1 bile acid:sodium symporter family protein [Methanobrevibacter sp.]MBR7050415.1 bile acid:sodium symporter family protein [Methanobrevibacter sp.]